MAWIQNVRLYPLPLIEQGLRWDLNSMDAIFYLGNCQIVFSPIDLWVQIVYTNLISLKKAIGAIAPFTLILITTPLLNQKCRKLLSTTHLEKRR